MPTLARISTSTLTDPGERPGEQEGEADGREQIGEGAVAGRVTEDVDVHDPEEVTQGEEGEEGEEGEGIDLARAFLD